MRCSEQEVEKKQDPATRRGRAGDEVSLIKTLHAYQYHQADEKDVNEEISRLRGKAGRIFLESATVRIHYTWSAETIFGGPDYYSQKYVSKMMLSPGPVNQKEVTMRHN